jgi:hypothetical protein
MKALQQRTSIGLARSLPEAVDPGDQRETHHRARGRGWLFRLREGLKRQLLEEKVVEKYGLEAKGEEMDAFAKRYVTDQFMQYGLPAPEGEQLQQMAGPYAR